MYRIKITIGDSGGYLQKINPGIEDVGRFLGPIDNPVHDWMLASIPVSKHPGWGEATKNIVITTISGTQRCPSHILEVHNFMSANMISIMDYECREMRYVRCPDSWGCKLPKRFRLSRYREKFPYPHSGSDFGLWYFPMVIDGPERRYEFRLYSKS